MSGDSPKTTGPHDVVNLIGVDALDGYVLAARAGDPGQAGERLARRAVERAAAI